MKRIQTVLVSGVAALGGVVAGYGLARINNAPNDAGNAAISASYLGPTERMEFSLDYRKLLESPEGETFAVTPDFGGAFALKTFFTEGRSVFFQYAGKMQNGTKGQAVGFTVIGDLCVENGELTLKNVRIDDLRIGDSAIVDKRSLSALLAGFVTPKLGISPLRLPAGALEVMDAYSGAVILKVKKESK